MARFAKVIGRSDGKTSSLAATCNFNVPACFLNMPFVYALFPFCFSKLNDGRSRAPGKPVALCEQIVGFPIHSV